MTGRRPALTFARATVAIVALYGFLLQAFLAGALPTSPAAAHPGLICSPSDPGAAGGDERPAGRSPDCCLAAHLPFAPAPSAAAHAFAPSSALALTWPHPPDHPRSAPDTHAASARGPPSA